MSDANYETWQLMCMAAALNGEEFDDTYKCGCVFVIDLFHDQFIIQECAAHISARVQAKRR